MYNLIAIIIILIIVAASITKIIVEKRKGVKCIGCPYSHKGKIDVVANLKRSDLIECCNSRRT